MNNQILSSKLVREKINIISHFTMDYRIYKIYRILRTAFGIKCLECGGKFANHCANHTGSGIKIPLV